ncbi:hypothetical protein [Polaribacter marinivivus]|uniref:Uncharacterized protein n=1 Tax=Polaribacter marinivivus TaxID=1524260 RepID=A0ABV8R9U7_9FLAO
MGETKTNQEKLYKNVETDGTTDNRIMKPTISSEESEILKKNNKEVLIGKNLDEIDKLKEDFNSSKRKLLNKLMR